MSVLGIEHRARRRVGWLTCIDRSSTSLSVRVLLSALSNSNEMVGAPTIVHHISIGNHISRVKQDATEAKHTSSLLQRLGHRTCLDFAFGARERHVHCK